jgi:predicted metalloprotease
LPGLYGVEFEPIADIIAYDVRNDDLPECGGRVLERTTYEFAFYCQPDDFIGWDNARFFPALYERFGDFAVALVIAHEWGHAIQQRAGISGATIDEEMQADCFAGAWANSILNGDSDLVLSAGDLDEAIAGFLVFRDAPGTPQSDPGAHGTAFQRVAAFRDGVVDGVRECRKFASVGG